MVGLKVVKSEAAGIGKDYEVLVGQQGMDGGVARLLVIFL